MAIVDRLDLLRAHRAARLQGSLDEALQNPALAIGLRNVAEVITRRADGNPPSSYLDVKSRRAGERTEQE